MVFFLVVYIFERKKLIIKPEDELVLKNQILSLYAKEDDRSFGKWVAKNWRWETIQYFLKIGLEQTVKKAYEAAVDDAILNEQPIIAQ